MAAFVGRRHSSPFSTSLSPLTTSPSNSHPLSSSSDDDDDEVEDDDRSNYYTPMPEPASIDPRDSNTSDNWIPRHPSLIRLTGKHPFNSEPPLSLLMSHGFLTPVPIHYVRNHGPVPQTAWSSWSIDISGLVRRPCRLSMDSLLLDFPSFQIPVTLVCAGNRRKEQNMLRQTIGFNWGPAAISTSLWRGVRLRDVLKRCGIMRTRDGALNVCFEGAEDLPGGKYGTSLSKEVAMDPSRDIMIAYMQNEELLKPDHGFPVRMIMPGFIGGRMVKWLKRIIVTTKESESYYHYRDNRVLPSHVDAELADSEGWWYKPEYIINELNINSVITTPGHDEVLQIHSVDAYTLRGYAYSGGGRKVTRVEITVDGGETWQICALNHPEKPNKYGKYWCWCFWSLDIDPLRLLSAEDIAVRAWDQTLNTQPENPTWNLMGMMNNCWFRVRVAVSRPSDGPKTLTFEHPTQPGNNPGGWMSRRRENPNSSTELTLKKIVSVSVSSTSNAGFSISEVRTHSSSSSAWIVVHDKVHDCTPFLKDHPGGADSILINAGSDCTEEFDAIHSDKAKSMLETYCIGHLVVTSDANAAAGDFKNQRENIPVTLVAKTSITRNLRLFRFALPSPHQLLGLPTGKHILLSAKINHKLCMRAYTPTSPEDAAGYFELMIRIYFKGENPNFPAGGLMTQHLDSLPLGAAMEIKSPVGRIEYAGKGSFVVDGKKLSRARRVAMVAGGTGITPVYQVIRAVMREEEGVEMMHLVYASRSEDEVLMREELDGWAREKPERFKVWYVVSKVTEGVLRENIPMGGDEDCLALVCGPPGMVEGVVLPTLEKMGYHVGNDSCLVF
ncbi:nitrate reductase [NAD(P)H] [Dendrobium catenatum]|nr:nitrate reductase [NAD(P)H] [Dendrobium catenatum]